METLIVVFHVLAALCVIGLVLIQQGKGADMGASFGAGASQTLFGSRGTGNVLTRSTAILATIFFATSLALVAWLQKIIPSQCGPCRFAACRMQRSSSAERRLLQNQLTRFLLSSTIPRLLPERFLLYRRPAAITAQKYRICPGGEIGIHATLRW